MSIAFDNTYARLPDRFYARIQPAPVAAPRLVRLNAPLAERLGLDPAFLAGPEGVEILAGNRIPEGAEPIALAYAGHQFGGFVPRLGDGRAVLLGELVDRNGARFDLQLKGSGRTPFSRSGDGRAPLGPVLREYIICEAMAALGVPTTRALAAIVAGERIMRESWTPAGVLARVASSHIRIGTFEYFAARGDAAALRRLADYAIARHDPALQESDQPYRAFLDQVIARQAALVAQWQALGFIHGVMNTDNMTISGETIDYGPCAFLDAYKPTAVFSSIDYGGRYAYANQPSVARWNLTRLAECLAPLLAADDPAAADPAKTVLLAFTRAYNHAWLAEMRRKLGLSREGDGDFALAQDLLDRMATGKADFTLTFRLLCDAAADPGADAAMRALFADPALYDAWAVRWRERLAAEPADGAARKEAMRSANPARIPRNHRVEAAIAAAVEEEDFGPFEELVAAQARPYEDQPAFAAYAAPPEPAQRVHMTFCGT